MCLAGAGLGLCLPVGVKNMFLWGFSSWLQGSPLSPSSELSQGRKGTSFFGAASLRHFYMETQLYSVSHSLFQGIFSTGASSLQTYLQVFPQFDSWCVRGTTHTRRQGCWFVLQPLRFSCDCGWNLVLELTAEDQPLLFMHPLLA